MFFVVVVFLFRFDIFVVISFTVAKKFFFLSVSIYKYIYTLNISLFHNVRIVEFIRCVFRFFFSCCYYMLSLYSREKKRENYIQIFVARLDGVVLVIVTNKYIPNRIILSNFSLSFFFVIL